MSLSETAVASPSSSRLKVSQLAPPVPVIPSHVAASLQATSRHVRSHLAGTLLLPLKERLYCNLCCQKMSDGAAFELSSCGHVFCDECIRVLREHNTNAPGDSIAAKLVGVVTSVSTHSNLVSSNAIGSQYGTFSEHNTTRDVDVNRSEASDESDGTETLVIECPICLRESVSVVTTSPIITTPEFLCDECKNNEKQIHCSQCRLELCAACDAKIHQFKAFSNHVRTIVGCGGNVDDSNLPETTLVCQSPLHVAVSEVMSLDASSVEGTKSNGAVHDSKASGPIATYLCLDTGELICSVCAGLPAYACQTCAPISDAAVLRATQIREVAGRVRGWAARAREHIQNVRIASAADMRLRDEAVAALLTTRDSIVSFIDEKFALLERQLREMSTARRSNIDKEIENLCLTVQGALESVTSAEKHAAQRQASVFVSEFETLLQNVNTTGKKLERVVCTLPEPVSRRYPLLTDISGVMESINSIGFDPSELTVESFSVAQTSTIQGNNCSNNTMGEDRLMSKQDSMLISNNNGGNSRKLLLSQTNLRKSNIDGVQGSINQMTASLNAANSLISSQKCVMVCKMCSTPIVTGCADLKQVSLKQRGALYGLPGKVILAQHVTLDRKKGTVGSRHVICTRCGADIGRWAERETVENKFVPGLIYISSNSVKN